MSRTQPSITRISNPDPQFLGDSATELLMNLPGPAFIEIEGQDRSRRRVVVTLLHGNEPSGLKALHRILTGDAQPATDLGIVIAGVDAARHTPVFSHRFIPGERDLNRCFAPPSADSQGELAANIVSILQDYDPEAVVDTHNTSAHSQPFCVAVNSRPATLALARCFADHLIVINQSLGTLLEHLDPSIPIVTAEFGGFMDPRADDIALATLRDFVTMRQPGRQSGQLTVLERALRLETRRELTVAYGSTLIDDADLTVINTIDQLNFRTLPGEHTLGWFTQASHGHLQVVDPSGKDVFADYFSEEAGLLQTRNSMTIFMATTDPVVANTDCLLYFNPSHQP